MSTWGDGNFDSDFACDYLTEIVYYILASIKKCLDELNTNDICGNASLMPGVDILLTLAKVYPNVVISILEDEDIQEWQNRYLRVFDKRNDHINTPQRRAIIVQSFSDLIELIGNER